LLGVFFQGARGEIHLLGCRGPNSLVVPLSLGVQEGASPKGTSPPGFRFVNGTRGGATDHPKPGTLVGDLTDRAEAA